MRKAILSILFVWIAVFYAAPIGVAVLFSFLSPGTYGGVRGPATLANYEFVRPDLLIRTGLFALTAALICTAVSLLISMEACLRPHPLKSRVILGLAVFTLVTNSLVKIYSWMLILGSSGPLGFLELGDSSRVLIGLVHLHLPLSLLWVFEGVRSIDPGIVRAARDLGAGDAAIVRRILLPLSRPLALGSLFLVTVFGFAEFLVPQILGRGKVTLTGNRMAELFGAPHFNWPACMAIGSTILVMLFAVLLIRRKAPA